MVSGPILFAFWGRKMPFWSVTNVIQSAMQILIDFFSQQGAFESTPSGATKTAQRTLKTAPQAHPMLPQDRPTRSEGGPGEPSQSKGAPLTAISPLASILDNSALGLESIWTLFGLTCYYIVQCFIKALLNLNCPWFSWALHFFDRKICKK